jgi:hypothetical protein
MSSRRVSSELVDPVAARPGGSARRHRDRATFGKTSSLLIVIAYAPCVTDLADRVLLRNQAYTAHASQNAEAADTRPERQAVIYGEEEISNVTFSFTASERYYYCWRRAR